MFSQNTDNNNDNNKGNCACQQQAARSPAMSWLDSVRKLTNPLLTSHDMVHLNPFLSTSLNAKFKSDHKTGIEQVVNVF